MKYIKGFDTLRAISVILVLVTHLGAFHYLPENNFVRLRVWSLLSGTTGVMVFFTLSGFLITRILLIELQRFQNLDFLKFYARRFLRLLPPLLIFYGAVLVLMKTGQITNSNAGFLFSFFYLYNFVPKQYYTGELGHTWSLALEEQYYLLWPFVIQFVRRQQNLVVLLITFLLLSLVAVYAFPHWDLTHNFKSMRWFIPAAAPIIIGSLFAILVHNKEREDLVMLRNSNWLLAGAVILFLAPLYSPDLRLNFLPQSTGVALLFVWILYNQESTLVKILDNKPLSYIGKISYGLYVYQGLFLKTGPGPDPSQNIWIQSWPQNIMLTFVVAILSYHLLEQPVLKLKKRFTRIA